MFVASDWKAYTGIVRNLQMSWVLVAGGRVGVLEMFCPQPRLCEPRGADVLPEP